MVGSLAHVVASSTRQAKSSGLGVRKAPTRRTFHPRRPDGPKTLALTEISPEHACQATALIYLREAAASSRDQPRLPTASDFLNLGDKARAFDMQPCTRGLTELWIMVVGHVEGIP